MNKLKSAINAGQRKAAADNQKRLQAEAEAAENRRLTDARELKKWKSWLKTRLYTFVRKATASNTNSYHLYSSDLDGSDPDHNVLGAINSFPGFHAVMRSEEVNMGDSAAPCMVTSKWIVITWNRS